MPELFVENPLDQDVLLYDGEELVGAKQNRILNVSVLVAAGSKLPISLQPGQCGAVLAIGRDLCLDVVSRPDAFAQIYPKLRAGYMLDALGRLDGPATRADTVRSFVARLSSAGAARGPSAGRGVDIRLRGDGVLGTGLELGRELVQLSAYSSSGSPRPFGRIARPSLRR